LYFNHQLRKDFYHMNNLSTSFTQYCRNFLPIYILLTFLVAGDKEPLVTFESGEMSITAELIADGLGVPWALTFLNPDEILFTERDGDMGILNPKTSKIIWLEGVPEIRQDGQGGVNGCSGETRSPIWRLDLFHLYQRIQKWNGHCPGQSPSIGKLYCGMARHAGDKIRDKYW